jgi:serine/threonine protein kinase
VARETSELDVELTHSSSTARFDHYQLLTREDGTPLELGHGAMGVTYKAVDINLQCAVALKVINARFIGDESARRRFVREARAAAKVRHTNVASVFHLGQTGDGYFYAMEYVEGETLENLIKRSGKLEPKIALEIASQVAAGLSAIDEQSLVHRDIKPTNIMVNLQDGGRITAKIIDLGLAKPVADALPEFDISIPGAFAGTPAFAPPFVKNCTFRREITRGMGLISGSTGLTSDNPRSDQGCPRSRATEAQALCYFRLAA